MTPFAAILAQRDLSDELPLFLRMLGCTEVTAAGQCSLEDALAEGFEGAAMARVAGWSVVIDPGFPVTARDVVPGLNSRFERTLASRSTAGEVVHLCWAPQSQRYALCLYRNARQLRGWLEEGGSTVEDHGEPFETLEISDREARVRSVLTERIPWSQLESARFRVFHYSYADKVPAANEPPPEPSRTRSQPRPIPVPILPPAAPPPVDDLGQTYGWERPSDPDEQVEQALRWRLVLGQFSEDHLGAARLSSLAGLSEGGAGRRTDRLNEALRMDRSLEYVYDREFARRAHRQAGGGGGGGLTVPAWLAGVRTLFPAEAVAVIENDALLRYGMTELVTDPEILRNAEPSEDLLKAILQFKHKLEGEVLDAARDVVKAVVDKLSDTLRTECAPALHGVIDPNRRPPQRTFRNTDWRKTVIRNLKHWDPTRQRLIADRIFFKHRQRMKSQWRIIIAVDQSGSMLDSLIHSSVMAAIFANLPTVDCHLVLWDHRLMDVSELADDPLEVLMSCQLGGGTEMWPAMQYCSQLITEPERTLFVLISDWYIWGEKPKCLALAHQLHEAGVTGIGLCALDADCRPIYDEAFAKDLAGQGWFVAALTPKQLAEHVGKIIA